MTPATTSQSTGLSRALLRRLRAGHEQRGDRRRHTHVSVGVYPPVLSKGPDGPASSGLVTSHDVVAPRGRHLRRPGGRQAHRLQGAAVGGGEVGEGGVDDDAVVTLVGT